MSILQPAKLVTPATADFGFVVQVNVAPAGVVMVRLTEAVLLVTVLPPASWIATTGWVAKTTLTALVEGLTVKPSRLAGPTVIVKLVLTALVRPLEVAVRV